MKKLTVLLLSLLLCLSCVAALASCDSAGTPEETTGKTESTTAPAEDTTEAPVVDATTEAPAEDVTETPSEEVTEDATSDETKGDSDEPLSPDDTEYDPELYVVIRSAEDLMAFNKAVNEDMEYFDDMVVVFTADIDMTGYEWIPLNGECLFGVTFEGNGHAIKNLRFAEYAPEPRPNDPTYASTIGSGFVGVAVADMTFQNLNFDTVSVTAYERAVGCFIGVQTGGYAWFENCKVSNFTADGWMDYANQDRDNGGHPISFRLAGFVGHNMAGGLGFMNCHVENIKLSGFHNLAGFVGYGSATLDAYAFEECSVKNLECTFSYCMSDSYTIDQEKKYVSVFFNAADWVDNIDLCVELGNVFEGVSYYDWTDDNAEYTPSDFRSWDGIVEDPAA